LRWPGDERGRRIATLTVAHGTLHVGTYRRCDFEGHTTAAIDNISKIAFLRGCGTAAPRPLKLLVFLGSFCENWRCLPLNIPANRHS
jgi:hypothetical protein